jgi:hypothetical protein
LHQFVALLYALAVNGQRFGGCILRDDFEHAFGVLSVKRFGAAIVLLVLFVFIVFPGLGFEHAGFRVVGAASPEVFVAFAHVAIRKSGRLAQQLVDNFVQVVHVSGERISVGQVARAQRVVPEISF